MILTESNKLRQNLKNDPIKSINNESGGSASEIVRMIALALGFKIHEDGNGVSAYGGNTIRIADHCTYMQTWVDNGTWKSPIRLDIVIEDNPTKPITQVKNGFEFDVLEYVYSSQSMEPQKARLIAYDIKNTLNGNPYANNVRGVKRTLKSTHIENNTIKENTNMKKIVRLTESDIKRMVMETLNELEYIDPESSLDNPNEGDPFGDYRDEIVNDYNGDEKAAENAYSWGLNQGDYPSTLPFHRVNRNGVNKDIDDIQSIRNRSKEWSQRQLRSADKMKNRWIKGERDLDDIDDAFYGSSLDEAITRAIRKYLR